MLLLEGRILGAALKEVPERFVQVTHGLLRGNTGDFVQPSIFSLLFQRGHGGAGVTVVDALLPLIVRIGTQPQRPIIGKASAAKGASQDMALLLSRIGG